MRIIKKHNNISKSNINCKCKLMRIIEKKKNIIISLNLKIGKLCKNVHDLDPDPFQDLTEPGSGSVSGFDVT